MCEENKESTNGQWDGYENLKKQLQGSVNTNAFNNLGMQPTHNCHSCHCHCCGCGGHIPRPYQVWC